MEQNRNPTTSPKEEKVKQPLTEEQRQRRRKMIVYPLMGLLFAGSMWLIFSPSDKEKEEAQQGMGYVNMFNRGVARVQTLLEENGNGRANFVIDRITTFGVNIKDASFNDAVEGGTTPKTTPKTTLKTTAKTTAKIIEAIENNPYITRQEMADTLNITLDGVKWQLNKLKKEGFIKREGSSRNGKWVVIKK